MAMHGKMVNEIKGGGMKGGSQKNGYDQSMHPSIKSPVSKDVPIRVEPSGTHGANRGTKG